MSSTSDALEPPRRLTDALDEALPGLAWRAQALLEPLPHAVALLRDHAGCTLSLDALDAALGPVDLATLLPPALRRAVRRRQLAFAAGRLCAERALATLDAPRSDVPREAGGEPRWPPGFVGSITHTDVAAHALVLRRAACDGVGIDSEPVADARAAGEVASVCCSASERARWLSGQDAGVRTTVLFAAKEAFYKAAHPVVRRFVDFAEAEAVAWDEARGTLALGLGHLLASPGTVATVHWRVDAATVHASVFLDAAIAGRLRR